MLPKLNIRHAAKPQELWPPQKYSQDYNKLASQVQRLTGAISHLCKFLQNSRSEQKQPQSHRTHRNNDESKKNKPNPESREKRKLNEDEQHNQNYVSMHNKLRENANSSLKIVNENEDVEERFRDIGFSIKVIQPQENREREILKFVANLLSRVFSRGFYYLEKGLFNDKKYRNFCCSNILIKLLEFAKLNSITQSQFNFINNHLAEKALPYQKLTYPKAQSQQVNLKLAESIYEINNYDVNENDLIFQSKIKFSKKNSGDYTAQIMKFINFILEKSKVKEKIQQESQEQEKWQTLSESYFKEMSAFFQRIYHEKWVTKAKKNDKQFNFSLLEEQYETKNEEQNEKKEEYEKKVKSYTKYQIGLKISENVRQFSSKSILEQNFELSNPGLMRVLTKWAQDLEEYIFDTNKTIINRQQHFIMMDGSESYLTESERVSLAGYLENQRPVLKNYLAQMSKSMSINQFKTLNSSWVEQFESFATEKEAYVGCFATMGHKSNANYLINYLNKLIDCILTAQVEWYLSLEYQQLSCAYLIPSLISFSIGDLMRCKISSKQKEITALFNYLNYISRTSPEKLQIIRIKNRLRQGTKDVLINLRYKKSIIVEIQLAIEDEKSTFIQCSEKANHFIYELERARFGPISEICNVWCVNDERYKFFSNMFQELNAKPIKKELNLCQHKKQEEKFPIWCSFCSGFVSNISAVTPHLKCLSCKTQICFKCLCKYGNLIVENSLKIDKQGLLDGKQENGNFKIVKAIDIEKKVRTEKELILLRIKNEFVIFEKIKQNEYEIILKSENHRKIIRYFSNFLILQASNGSSSSTLKYLQSEYFRKYFEQARIKMNRIIMYEGKINIKLIQSERFIHLKKLCLTSAGLTQIGQMPNIFPFCQIAILNKNNISDFINIEKWKSLVELHLEQNEINDFPEPVCELTNLQTLNLSQNNLTLLPENLGNLTNLLDINLRSNHITQLPESFKNLTKLQEINIMWNSIENLSPHIFDDMKDLKKFLFKENLIQDFPYGLTRLQNIEQIFLGCNKLSVISSEETFNCKKLKLLFLRQNNLTSAPKFIGSLKYLEECNLEQNQINHFEEGVWECKNLKSLNLNVNKLQFVPIQVSMCESLQTLSVTSNKIEKFQEGLWNLQKLKTLQLSYNNLKLVPKVIGGFKSLEILNISNNPIEEFEPGQWVCENLRVFNLAKTNLCQIPKLIGIFKHLKEFYIGNQNDVELELPQSILNSPEQLILTIAANFSIKAGSQQIYEKLNSRKQIVRKELQDL